jgi:hypothetical protein
VYRHARHPDDQGIGEARGQDAQPVAFLPIHASARDGLQAPAAQGIEQQRNVGRVVLSVAVERDHDLAARLVQAGAQRGGLAEVAGEVDHAQARLAHLQGEQACTCRIGAAVVHEHELGGLADAVEHGANFLGERYGIVLLVEHRHDDGDDRRCLHGGPRQRPRIGAARPYVAQQFRISHRVERLA